MKTYVWSSCSNFSVISIYLFDFFSLLKDLEDAVFAAVLLFIFIYFNNYTDGIELFLLLIGKWTLASKIDKSL